MEKKHYVLMMITCIIGIFIGLGIFIYLFESTDKTLNILKSASIIFVGISVLIGIYQLSANVRQIRYSNDWNKKQLATTRLHESEKNIKTALTALHSTLNVVGRDIENPYKYHEIHDNLGVFLEDRKTFVFHGEQTDDDIKNLPKNENQKKNHTNKFNHEINGREVRDNIIALLNEYEYISSSVNCDIFDKESVMRLMDLKILRTYLRFQEYINHLRNEHGGGSTTYKELEDFANEIKKLNN